jgi:hypothetical protein
MLTCALSLKRDSSDNAYKFVKPSQEPEFVMSFPDKRFNDRHRNSFRSLRQEKQSYYRMSFESAYSVMVCLRKQWLAIPPALGRFGG